MYSLLQNLPLLGFASQKLALLRNGFGSGKTHLQLHLTKLFAENGCFDWIRCITPTEFNKQWSNCLGDDYVIENLDEKQLIKLLN